MYVFRLGIISTLLSETLVNGFTTGAAFHVLVSQIKDLFGLHVPRHKGAFTVINVCTVKKTIWLQSEQLTCVYIMFSDADQYLS